MPVRIGVIGAGNISDQYLTNLTSYPEVEVVRVGDIDISRAQAQAAKYGVPRHGDGQSVLDDPEVDLVVNLTIPVAHAEVTQAALAAGKHVWLEKPLATVMADADGMLTTAQEAGLMLGCAPDTVLGPGIQAALRASTEVGQLYGGLAAFGYAGPDSWHPGPDFFFAPGGGPTLDMGPYYLTSLVLGLGSVTEIRAVGSQPRTTRSVMAGPRAGETFSVHVPTTMQAVLSHEGGASSLVLLSFDLHKARRELEFHGVEGTVVCPDPNRFDGEVRIVRHGQDDEVREVEEAGNGRGVGIIDMIRSRAAGTTHIANGGLARHVLDIMLGLEAAAAGDGHVTVSSRAPLTAPLPGGWSPLHPQP